jgi:hypothetical protein
VVPSFSYAILLQFIRQQVLSDYAILFQKFYKRIGGLSIWSVSPIIFTTSI